MKFGNREIRFGLETDEKSFLFSFLIWLLLFIYFLLQLLQSLLCHYFGFGRFIIIIHNIIRRRKSCFNFFSLAALCSCAALYFFMGHLSGHKLRDRITSPINSMKVLLKIADHSPKFLLHHLFLLSTLATLISSFYII